MAIFAKIIIAKEKTTLAGGWSDADISAPEVVDAASFAIGRTYPGVQYTFKIVTAQKQAC